MTLPVRLFAAGSLKSAFVPLCAQFSASTGIAVTPLFGPAGLLRERIERGEACDLFASASADHAQALLHAGRATAADTFAFNRLCLTVRRTPATDGRDWLSLLADDALRTGTSTPGCDPSGDYAWQLFDHIERQHPGLGRAIAARAIPLVGGRDTVTIPGGEIASAWLLRQGLADIFIGYAHYGATLARAQDIRTLALPEGYSPRCEYQLARLGQGPDVRALSAWILGAQGQHCLRAAGFLTPQ